jgi:RNA polymerase sigma-70 factor (ECF subfamily)
MEMTGSAGEPTDVAAPSDVPVPIAASRPDVVERVWRESGPRLYRSLVAYTGDPDLASDAMAEAFAQALGRGNDLRDADRWIWRAAFLLAKGELKNRGRVRPMELPEHSSEDMPEPVADVVTALRTLSPQQRMAVILMLYVDLTARDAGRIMGCSAPTVRVHFTQARRRLRPLLEGPDA